MIRDGRKKLIVLRILAAKKRIYIVCRPTVRNKIRTRFIETNEVKKKAASDNTDNTMLSRYIAFRTTKTMPLQYVNTVLKDDRSTFVRPTEISSCAVLICTPVVGRL